MELGIYVTVSSNCSLVSDERARGLVGAGLRMVGTDFCADAALYERLRARGIWKETFAGIQRLRRAAVEAKADFRIVIKDLATHGRPPQEAKSLIEQTQPLFSEWQEQVTVMRVYFHNALGESLMNLSGPAATSNGGVYRLCHQPWVNFTVDFAGRWSGAAAICGASMSWATSWTSRRVRSGTASGWCSCGGP